MGNHFNHLCRLRVLAFALFLSESQCLIWKEMESVQVCQVLSISQCSNRSCPPGWQADGREGGEVLYMGIIDILQELRTLCTLRFLPIADSVVLSHSFCLFHAKLPANSRSILGLPTTTTTQIAVQFWHPILASATSKMEGRF